MALDPFRLPHPGIQSLAPYVPGKSAEDLAKDLENLIKQYKEKATKSKTESTDKLKNLIGKISKTIILNLDRGDK